MKEDGLNDWKIETTGGCSLLQHMRHVQVTDLFDRAACLSSKDWDDLRKERQIVNDQCSNVLLSFMLNDEESFVRNLGIGMDGFQYTHFASQSFPNSVFGESPLGPDWRPTD